jgi:SulP family sulfate permease
MNPMLQRFLPFLRWFPLKEGALKADFIAGLTVALVLIPQSMAYAQLAGMPAFYGLYAAFLPVAIAALWGSSNQLATGPVAVVSLLTASALVPFATPGSDHFIALAIMLTLLVGLVQLLLGVFKLGVIVNFLSHPVIVGFTNAAAIIIGLSQVSKLFGVPMGRSEHFIVDIWGVFRQVGDTHLPTLLMGLAAIAIMWAIRKYRPKWPGVLIAVVLTTLVSWGIGFEKKAGAVGGDITAVRPAEVLADYEVGVAYLKELEAIVQDRADEVARLEKADAPEADLLAANYREDVARTQAKAQQDYNAGQLKELRHYAFVREEVDGKPGRLFLAGEVPPGVQTDGRVWYVKKVEDGKIQLTGGGEVVGNVPPGLPSLTLPSMDMSLFGALLSTALVISLVGFMEAISIAKAIAAKTKQRLDPNQELVGQGLANIVGSFSQAFPTSGSFSRSAVNLNAGAVTGLSSVITAIIVLVTLLLLTPLLYHLPQAVLAAIIIMAVIGLVNFAAVKHAWQASRHDGAAAIVTFIATLAFAPHLDNGIMVGAGLAIVLYLLRTMTPRVAVLGRFPDGTLRDVKVHPTLPTSEHVIAMRFDGSLYFANVSFFEDTILEAVASHPKTRFVLVVADGMNQLDASGEEVIHHLIDRLRETGINLVFSGLKKQVLDVMRGTGLFEMIGQDNIFATEDLALAAIYERLGEDAADDLFCVVQKPAAV